MTSSASRRHLPDRRPSITRTVKWAGKEFSLTVGYFLNGRPGEIFMDGPKTGSDMRAILADTCVVISLALQHGIEPAALAHSLARVPVSETESAPASVIGAVVELLVEGLSVPATEPPQSAPTQFLAGPGKATSQPYSTPSG